MGRGPLIASISSLAHYFVDKNSSVTRNNYSDVSLIFSIFVPSLSVCF